MNWDRWAHHQLPEEETRAWKNIIETICTTTIQTIDDLAAPVYWAEVTALKILFPDEFLLSHHAAIAQNKFPQADLNQWKSNEKGPTKHPNFKANKHVLQASRELVQAGMTEAQQQLSKRPWSSRTDDGSEEECPAKKRRLTDSDSAKEATPELSIVRK